MSSEECPICAEKFTSTLRKKINCPRCNIDVCLKCFKTYLLDNVINEPHCMSCKQGFNRYFLQTNLSKTFIDKDYAKHREEFLWNLEESFIPSAQIKAERILQGRALSEEKHEDIYEAIRLIDEKIYNLKEQKFAYNSILRKHYNNIDRLLHGLPLEENSSESDESKDSKKKFIRKCSVNECKGWLSSAWKCGICENYTCNKCFVIKGKKNDDTLHVCKEEDIASAELIKKETKPCPKCGEGIYKTEGCQVMFCTSCNTPFNWTTLEIIKKGNIHNPHYFEWRNRVEGGLERTPGDIPCGGIPTDDFIWRLANSPSKLSLVNIYHFINHVSDYELNKYREAENNNEELRVKYLLNEITKEEFKRTLQIRERKNERNKVIRDIFNTFIVAASEELRIFEGIILEAPYNASRKDSIEGVPEFNKAFKKFRDAIVLLSEFVNESFAKTSKTYGCTVPQIDYTLWSVNTKKFKSFLENS